MQWREKDILPFFPAPDERYTGHQISTKSKAMKPDIGFRIFDKQFGVYQYDSNT